MEAVVPLELVERGSELYHDRDDEDEYKDVDDDDDDDGYASPQLHKPSMNKRNRSLHASCLACCSKSAKSPRKGRRRTGRLLLYCIVGCLTVLGLVQFVALTLGAFVSFFPSDIERAIARSGRPGQPGEYLSHAPNDTTDGVIPIPCHSHNDYWRPVPLFSALEAGCISVEADIWLFDGDLFVGHTTGSLAPDKTLTKMYIDPLVEILEKQNPIAHFHPNPNKPPNGVFDTKPSQTLVLLIDFKNKGADAWPYLLSQLSPLRDRGYLTYFNGTSVTEGPVTVVATGKAHFENITANDTYRDVFFDAPLDKLAKDAIIGSAQQSSNLGILDDEELEVDELDIVRSRRNQQNKTPKRYEPRPVDASPTRVHRNEEGSNPYVYNPKNSYYASVSFRKSIGFPWSFRLSHSQLDLLRAQVRGAHQRGLKVRYWSTPSWPRSLRNYLWTVLIREGVDILNVDDLRSAAKMDWGESTLLQ
ncbi:uncharacterized protein BDCG_06190 [Blastomyces dermatitidis ER-3]|uniref:Altered inheritance of mitochondria protein 6 n=2 Tax=Blastomyces TaxID=229219 RepID=A0A179UA94_BLAGS|nr:uncharacterized protein BDBG_00835 [Blastomyces gilchristii SLH14081]XP_045277676.1 uncharacterized protein BDCG_06190 [Blastomyces dermatitidis ER-3]EEQ91070.1 hypothetical protein BDCG_06190 [Blastomyces dermatitidis ER-3]EQL36164.1 hypothetical protein BDFG_02406 [Blastomyces dermatitidis ATCC 26199]OAT04238.1 hypothetical protein BDBG_00835 [Blastomyces gilchristii SLH14081]